MKKDYHIPIGKHHLKPNQFTVIAGPCSIESYEQFSLIAKEVTSLGAHVLRGGLYKMRTAKESFQGLGEKAYEIVKAVKSESKLPFISEITDTKHITSLKPYVDAFQVGTRNMYNYTLLKELSKLDKAVVLKRGFSATIKEWLLASEYLKDHHNHVIFCERGIRTFETATRNTFDINAVAYLSQKINYPIIADPSHGVGVSDLVIPVCLAAVMAGADGMIVEVHNEPKKALSDAFQALDFFQFETLMKQLKKILPLVNKSL